MTTLTMKPQGAPVERHEVLDVLTTAVVASVCGAERCSDFAAFARKRETLLRSFLRLKNGLPNEETFARVLRLFDAGPFGRALEAFFSELGEAGDGARAMDGRTLRRAFDHAAARSPLEAAVAFGAGDATAVIRKPAPEGSSETLAACAMLEMLALDGVLVVVPAEQVRNEPAVIIHRRGGAYLVPVPANRPSMLRALSDLFAAPPKPLRSLEAAVPLDGGVEIRRHRVARHVGCLLPSIDAGGRNAAARTRHRRLRRGGRTPARRPPATTSHRRRSTFGGLPAR
jgi:hypothetical protein